MITLEVIQALNAGRTVECEVSTGLWVRYTKDSTIPHEYLELNWRELTVIPPVEVKIYFPTLGDSAGALQNVLSNPEAPWSLVPTETHTKAIKIVMQELGDEATIP